MGIAIDLLVDSGAYSAFTRGRAISVKEYTDFCLANKQYIKKVVNLDVINPQDPEVAANSGMSNFLYMKSLGVDAMPVYHARERITWLDQMFREGADYIGLSGTSLVSPVESRTWHDIVWSYVTDASGNPIAKFHAFGDTAPFSMLTYPWFSADSATWMIQAGRAARVKLQGKSYQLRSSSIRDTSYISNDDPEPQKQAWQDEIRMLGLDPDIVMSVATTPSEMAMIRSYLVASGMLRLAELTKVKTKYERPASLLMKKKQSSGGTPRIGGVEMYFVISPSAWYFNLPILAALNIKKVLVSYYYIATAPAKFWQERLLPFLYDPNGFCEREPKLRKYYDKLQECLLKSKTVPVGKV